MNAGSFAPTGLVVITHAYRLADHPDRIVCSWLHLRGQRVQFLEDSFLNQVNGRFRLRKLIRHMYDFGREAGM